MGPAQSRHLLQRPGRTLAALRPGTLFCRVQRNSDRPGVAPTAVILTLPIVESLAVGHRQSQHFDGRAPPGHRQHGGDASRPLIGRRVDGHAGDLVQQRRRLQGHAAEDVAVQRHPVQLRAQHERGDASPRRGAGPGLPAGRRGPTVALSSVDRSGRQIQNLEAGRRH